MTTSNTIYSFTISKQEGHTILTANEYPWSVLQVVPTTEADFDHTKKVLLKRGLVAHHDTDRTFFIIHLTSGDHDGQHPERHLQITQANCESVLDAIEAAMAQAAVWYKVNIIDRVKI